MLLCEIAIICANSTRTKAYLQNLCNAELFFNKCYIMSDEKEKLLQEADCYTENDIPHKYFNANEPLVYTLNKYNINYEIIETKDINSDIVLSTLQNTAEKYIVYSGFGGQILKSDLFNIGKQFIHVHAGILPAYRGSTTAYYSIINNKTLGATAIFMSDGIDEGNVILGREFSMPDCSLDIDYIYEPHIRALVLLESIQEFVKNGSFPCEIQQTENCETYFVIHPTLKHLAMLTVDLEALQNDDLNDI